MKKLSVLALVLSATVAITPVFAETTAHYNTPITELSSQQADLSFAFDDVEDLQAVAMTDGQMQETQGAVAPLVAYGIRMGVMGTIGAGANTWSHYSNTGKWSWGAAGRGFVVGAVGGGAAKYLGRRGW